MRNFEIWGGSLWFLGGCEVGEWGLFTFWRKINDFLKIISKIIHNKFLEKQFFVEIKNYVFNGGIKIIECLSDSARREESFGILRKGIG